MLATPLTLSEFFDDQPDREDLLSALDEGKHKKLQAVIKTTPGFSRDLIGNSISEAFKKMLDVNLLEIFFGAWGKLSELQAYLDRYRHPPNEISLVPLGEHTISSTHHPSLEILIKQKRIAELTFDVLLKLKLESFVLKIQDGCIHEIASGTYTGAGIVKYGEQKLVEKKSSTHRLPGNMALKECFEIPKLIAD